WRERIRVFRVLPESWFAFAVGPLYAQQIRTGSRKRRDRAGKQAGFIDACQRRQQWLVFVGASGFPGQHIDGERARLEAADKQTVGAGMAAEQGKRIAQAALG